jgi:hypothetical protein
MTSDPSSIDNNAERCSAPPTPSRTPASGEEYKVGRCRPPKEFQFKPRHSGNPKGAKRKPRSSTPDLKALFERLCKRRHH